MNAVALLDALTAAGVKVEARGNRLAVNAPAGALTPELHAQLAEQKLALLALLAGYEVATGIPADVAARGLAVQSALDTAFDNLPAHLQDVATIEAAEFWQQDGEEMQRLQDLGDWPGLLAALEQHLDRGLASYAQLRQKGGVV